METDIQGAGTPPTEGSNANPPVDQNGDQEAVLFDDLMTDKRGEKKTELPAKSVEALKGDGKDSKKESKSESKDDKKDNKKEPAKEASAGEKKEAAEMEAKKLKAKWAEKEYELEEEAVVTVKIDGRDVEVPIKDLLSNYSGKTAWDKRFSELDKDRKAYTQMKNESESKIKAIFEEQDPELRFYKMADLAGANPLEVRRKFLEDNLNLLEKWYSMSEDERKADELAYENRYLKHQQETMQQRSKLEQAKTQVQSKVEGLMATHKLDQGEFVTRYGEIESLIKEGKLEEEKLTPEFIAESLVKDRLWTSVVNAAADLKVEGVTEEKVLKLVELSYQEGLSPDEVAEVVSELWAGGKAKKVVAEKEKQRAEFYEGAKEEKPSKASSDVWSFDQL